MPVLEDESDPFGYGVDYCRFCGSWIGYGPKYLHLNLCEKATCQQQAEQEDPDKEETNGERG